MRSKLDTVEVNGVKKSIIVCSKIKRQELNESESIDIRIFYWAAYYGFDRYLKYMVLQRKWSPFIKSFRNRSIISGAIWGEQSETVRMLLGEFEYSKIETEQL